MPNIEVPGSWAEVPQLETTDRALAGPDGVMNKQAQALVARTNLLRGQVKEIQDSEFMAEPFGRTGIRVLVGEKDDAHYGLGSGWVHYEDTDKTVFFYRKGPKHGISNGSEVWAADSYDKGATLENYRRLYVSPLYDTRVQGARKFAKGRAGFLCNLMAENGDDYNPLLFYSDDQWVTYQYKELIRPVGSEAYSFGSHGGIIDFPLSQGGSDTEGFIAFGYMSPGGLDALTTKDNWETYTWHFEVAVATAPSTSLSEWSGFRLGKKDQWLFYLRHNTTSGWGEEVACFKTTNLLNWGPQLPGGAKVGGSPPAAFYDEETNKGYFVTVSRTSRIVYGRVNWMFLSSADADELWAANGNFLNAEGSVVGQPIMQMPDWFVGYFEFHKMGKSWWGTVVAGENGLEDGGASLLCWLGDFTPTGSDRTKWQYYLTTRSSGGTTNLDLVAPNNLPTTYPFTITNSGKSLRVAAGAYGMSNKAASSQTSDYSFDIGGYAQFNKIRGIGTDLQIHATRTLVGAGNSVPYGSASTMQIAVGGATTAALCTESAGTTSSRPHWFLRNPNGVVGTVSTNGAATSYATTSDETFKIFKGNYDPLKAIEIIRKDPVRAFKWDEAHGGSDAIGWGAQTSYKASKDLANPGGWFNEQDGTPSSEGAIHAVYIPWGVDQSKRTPYLWAAISYLLDERDDLIKRLEALEKKLNS